MPARLALRLCRDWRRCGRSIDVNALPPLVIPGRAKREPGIHTPDRGYGFRAQPCGLPRNDDPVVSLRTCARQQPFLDRLDLQRQIFRIDAALREAAGDEPQPRLAGARIHVAQLLAVAETPDRA